MIKGHFSDHFVLAVKDQIRSVRYRIRRSADGDPVRGAVIRPSRVPRPVAVVANAVFSQVETTARALLPDPAPEWRGAAFPLPVERYFGAGETGEDEGQAFTLAIYDALKQLLNRFGAREYLVFEQAIGEAHAAILARHSGLIAAALGAGSTASRSQPITQLCAAIAIELAKAHPIKEALLDPQGKAVPRNLSSSLNEYCACVVGLSTAIVSLRLEGEATDVPQGSDWIVQSADMAVDARFTRFAAAMASSDPTVNLAAEFAAILPFLP